MSSILFSLLDTPAIGGAEQYLLSNLEHLAKNGYLCVLGSTLETIQENIDQSIHFHKVPRRLDVIGDWKGLLKYPLDSLIVKLWFQKLVDQYRQSHPHIPLVFLSPGFTDRLTLTSVAKSKGLKIIWIEYGPLESVWSKQFGIPSVLYSQAKNHVDGVITISENTKKSLITTGKIDPNLIHIVYPGTKKWTSAERRKQLNLGKSWLQEHGLETKKIVISLGRLAHEKEFDLLLQAWRKISSAHHEAWALVVVGDGPARVDLESYVQINSLSNVVFAGRVSQELKHGILESSDIFVFPSSWELEGFGMTTIEAMSHELMVITSGHGPQSEIINHQTTGLFFKPKSPNSLANTLETVMQNKEKRTQIGAAAVQKASRVFSEAKMHTAFQSSLEQYL